MSDFSELVLNKLDKINDKIDTIAQTQAVQAKDIEHHIKRTDIAEDRLELLEDTLNPIKNHVNSVKWGIKIVLMGAVLLLAHGSDKIKYVITFITGM
jgi:hypothetical protein